jgi:hypothetical protein
MAAMPSDADALSRPPFRHLPANRINHAGNLMPRHARVLDPRPHAHLHQGIAVADAAGLDFDADGTGAGLRDRSLDDFERGFGVSNLGNSHRGHDLRPRVAGLRLDCGRVCILTARFLFLELSVVQLTGTIWRLKGGRFFAVGRAI